MSDGGARSPGPTGTDRPARAAPAAAEDGQATVRATVLLIVAVLLGLFIFTRGLEHEDASESSTAGTAVPTDFGPDRNAPPPTTTPDEAGTIPTVPPATTQAPADTTVYVANAADPAQPIAGDTADALEAEGWQIAGINDAPLSPTTRVYFAEGLEPEAQVIAGQLGFADDAVQPMPDPVPLPAATGVDILVLVGSDAGGAATTTTATTA